VPYCFDTRNSQELSRTDLIRALYKSVLAESQFDYFWLVRGHSEIPNDVAFIKKLGQSLHKGLITVYLDRIQNANNELSVHNFFLNHVNISGVYHLDDYIISRELVENYKSSEKKYFFESDELINPANSFGRLAIECIEKEYRSGGIESELAGVASGQSIYWRELVVLPKLLESVSEDSIKKNWEIHVFRSFCSAVRMFFSRENGSDLLFQDILASIKKISPEVCAHPKISRNLSRLIGILTNFYYEFHDEFADSSDQMILRYSLGQIDIEIFKTIENQIAPNVESILNSLDSVLL
jgi:hypothetical protein